MDIGEIKRRIEQRDRSDSTGDGIRLAKRKGDMVAIVESEGGDRKEGQGEFGSTGAPKEIAKGILTLASCGKVAWDDAL